MRKKDASVVANEDFPEEPYGSSGTPLVSLSSEPHDEPTERPIHAIDSGKEFQSCSASGRDGRRECCGDFRCLCDLLNLVGLTMRKLPSMVDIRIGGSIQAIDQGVCPTR